MGVSCLQLHACRRLPQVVQARVQQSSHFFEFEDVETQALVLCSGFKIMKSSPLRFCFDVAGHGVHIYMYTCIYIIYMGSGQNTLSRSLYKTTYLIVGVYIFIYNKRRHATRAP